MPGCGGCTHAFSISLVSLPSATPVTGPRVPVASGTPGIRPDPLLRPPRA